MCPSSRKSSPWAVPWGGSGIGEHLSPREHKGTDSWDGTRMTEEAACLCSHLGAECNKKSDGVFLHTLGRTPHSHPPRYNCPSALERRDLGQEQCWDEVTPLSNPGPAASCALAHLSEHTLSPALETCRQMELAAGPGLLTLLRVTGRYRVWGP